MGYLVHAYPAILVLAASAGSPNYVQMPYRQRLFTAEETQHVAAPPDQLLRVTPPNQDSETKKIPRTKLVMGGGRGVNVATGRRWRLWRVSQTHVCPLSGGKGGEGGGVSTVVLTTMRAVVIYRIID